MTSNTAVSTDKERILCAAVWVQNDSINLHQPENIETGFVICGFRHCNCFQVLSMTKTDYHQGNSEQGFLTNHNRFVTRPEAAKIAFEAGQIEKHVADISFLYSEDLY